MKKVNRGIFGSAKNTLKYIFGTKKKRKEFASGNKNQRKQLKKLERQGLI